MKNLKILNMFKNWKLKTKLIISFILILLIPSTVIGVFSFEKAKDVLGDYILDSATDNVKAVNNEILDTFEPKINDLEFLAGTISKDLYDENGQIHQQFSQYIELHQEVSAIYVGTTSGEMIVEPALDLPDDYDPRTRVWYEDAINSEGEVVITDPYLDASSNEQMITVARTTNDGTGVIGIDISLAEIGSFSKDIKIGEEGYIIILDAQNNYLYHPSEELGSKASGEWTETVLNGNEGQFSYSLDGNEKQMDFATNELTEWKVLGTLYTSELQDAASGIMVTTIIVVVVSLLVGLGLIFFIIRSITKPLASLTSSVKRISDGDLREPITVTSNDEIGQLATGINEMQGNLKNVITNVSTASDNLSSQSEELTQSASEVKSGSQQIATTMQELAEGTESQATHAGDLSTSMEAFSAKVNGAKDKGDIIYDSSNHVLGLTKEGSQLMNTSVKQMAVIDEIVKEAVNKVEGLDVESQKISKLVSVIKDIAEQTNLLALNAAIEAARAGEHGKGFAVVADEVRKLAEQVGVSVTDITGIVTNIQNESTDVAKSLQIGYTEVEKGTSQMKTTGETFVTINDAVEDMVKNIKSISENLTTMSSSSQEMSTSVEDIAAVAEESAAGVEETAASAQQASSSMEEVSGSSEELAKLAEELKELISQFKI